MWCRADVTALNRSAGDAAVNGHPHTREDASIPPFEQGSGSHFARDELADASRVFGPVSSRSSSPKSQETREKRFLKRTIHRASFPRRPAAMRARALVVAFCRILLRFGFLHRREQGTTLSAHTMDRKIRRPRVNGSAEAHIVNANDRPDAPHESSTTRLGVAPEAGDDLKEVRSTGEGVRNISDRDIQLVVIAPVVVDIAVR